MKNLRFERCLKIYGRSREMNESVSRRSDAKVFARTAIAYLYLDAPLNDLSIRKVYIRTYVYIANLSSRFVPYFSSYRS